MFNAEGIEVDSKGRPQPEPEFHDVTWLACLTKIMDGTLEDTVEALDHKIALLKHVDINGLYSKHYYLREDNWCSFTCTKEQIVNSYLIALYRRRGRAKHDGD